MAMYKVEFESSKQVMFHDDLKTLVNLVKGFFRFSLKMIDIPESIEPFETVRFSVVDGRCSFYWHLFSMYAVNNSCWGKCIVLSCAQTGNVQLIWQMEG